RFAEVVLTRAEALARQGRLAEAVVQYNRIRVRAGLAAHVLGTDVTSEDEVLAAIWNERRLEFAFEGDRWPDLVRTGRVPTVMGIPATAALYPIPQRELDIAPNMTQNPGY
ncbi:MAG TPA: RagB/SusD family nutrient uptake outer membrane protein, partial [Rhodothermales bacterium]|nr:RagB/SusD family nutrient uptake outer membrane protein [Rhodothermales bacterium]